MTALTSLPNVGKKLAIEMESINIYSWKDMADLGSIEIILRLRDQNLHTCLHKLYAIEGAIQGIRWHLLPHKTRDRLKQELKKYDLE